MGAIDDLEKRLQGRGFHRTPSISHTRRTLLALAFDAETRRWTASSDLIFRPEGLIVTGAPAGARLQELSIGHDRVFPIGGAPIALDAFALIEQMEEGHPMRPHYPTMEPDGVAAVTLIDAVGMSLGAPLTVTFWGRAVLS